MKRLGLRLIWGWLGLVLIGCGQSQAVSSTATIDVNVVMDAAATIPVTIPANTDRSIEGLVLFDEPSRNHDDNYRYSFTDLPPAGGVHHSVWMNCGVYTEPVPVELAIHSLEHGSVWIAYQPDLDAAAVTALQQFAKDQTHILVSPYPDLKSPIVLTAWARQLEVETSDDPRIAQFIEAFLHGTQSPEPGVTCGQGVGNPITIQ